MPPRPDSKETEAEDAAAGVCLIKMDFLSNTWGISFKPACFPLKKYVYLKE